MIHVEEKKPFVRYYMCECEQCDQCTGGRSTPVIAIDDLYELIKNPEPAVVRDFSGTNSQWRPYPNQKHGESENLFQHTVTSFLKYAK